jgi:hypothetical protein
MKLLRVTVLVLLLVAWRGPLCVPGAAVAAQNVAAQGGPDTQAAPKIERDEQQRVRVRLPRGGRVSLGNRTTGRISVVGWDNDYIEAMATSERGTEHVRAASESGPSGQRVELKADYLSESWPSLPSLAGPSIPPHSRPSAPPPQRPAAKGTGPEGESGSAGSAAQNVDRLIRLFNTPSEVHLEVKLPRYAEIDLITVNRSEVEITGLPTSVTVSGKRSAIRLRDVGAVEIRTERGPVEVDGAGGLVDVVTTGGSVSIRNVRGDVRALSLSGRIEVHCVRGRVNVSNTEGPVFLAGVDGDVDATTVNSDVRFDGPVRAEGRYHLKSMSGAVEMSVRRNPPGFTALLSSYRGRVESDFKLTTNQPPNGTSGSRLLGRYGDGRAQITLDSFDGRVKLGRPGPGPPEACR